jgi:nitrogen regulatory protein P-II 1
VIQLVTAIIRPSRIDDVREVLEGMGITVTEVHGFSRQGGHVETYRGSEYQIELVPKVKVELVVEAVDVDRVLAGLIEAARTGKLGDGKAWVTPVDQVVRIRTGEDGPVAL